MRIGDPRLVIDPAVSPWHASVVRHLFSGAWTVPLTVVVPCAHSVKGEGGRGFGAFTPTGLRRPCPVTTTGPTIIVPGLLPRRPFLTTLAHEVAHFDEYRGGREAGHGPAFQRRNRSRRAALLRRYYGKQAPAARGEA